MLEFYQQMATVLEREAIVLATIIHVKGSVPREVGAKMIICPDCRIIGTVGGGAGEARVIQQARHVLKTGKNQRIDIDLSGTPQRKTEGICGGMMQVWLARWQDTPALSLVHQIIDYLKSGQSAVLVTPLEEGRSPYLQSFPPSTPHPACFTESLLPSPTLLIVGAGHCALPLAHIAHLAGFRIVVQDDRPELATPERFPDAAQIVTQPIAEAINKLAPISQLYGALVTRGFTYDLEALQILLHLPLQYIGMIGSEKRVKTVFQTLQQSGESRYALALPKIHAPIGLDIGALTPEEIAVSICAELIKVRRGGTGRSLSDRMGQNRWNGSRNLSPLDYAQQSAQQQ